MHLPLIYRSWFSIAGALALWGAVVLFAWTISNKETERVARIADLEEAAERQSAMMKLHAFARETKDARADLEAIVSADVNGILDGIESVARDSGAAVEIEQASAGPDSSSPRLTTTFVITAAGNFANMVHVAALLESFPIPSSIDQLRFDKIESDDPKAPAWRLQARLRTYTYVSDAL